MKLAAITIPLLLMTSACGDKEIEDPKFEIPAPPPALMEKPEPLNTIPETPDVRNS